MNTLNPIVLLVEDDPDDAELIQRAFSRAGLGAVFHRVTDGEAAMNYLAGYGDFADRSRYPLPHLALLDLRLPRRSGMEVLAWMRKHPEFAAIRVVMMTSLRQAANLKMANELGAAFFLQKPVDTEQLLSMARTLGDVWQGALLSAAARPAC